MTEIAIIGVMAGGIIWGFKRVVDQLAKANEMFGSLLGNHLDTLLAEFRELRKDINRREDKMDLIIEAFVKKP